MFLFCLYVQETSKSKDLDFVYDDADKHANEIAELYSYTEQSELIDNLTVSIGISIIS